MGESEAGDLAHSYRCSLGPLDRLQVLRRMLLRRRPRRLLWRVLLRRLLKKMHLLLRSSLHAWSTLCAGVALTCQPQWSFPQEPAPAEDAAAEAQGEVYSSPTLCMTLCSPAYSPAMII